MREINFELLKVENPYLLNDFNKETFIINNSFELNNLNIKVNSNIDFNKNIIVGLKFYSGSVPKRTINNIFYDENNKSLKIITNKKDITFTTMDYRMHLFIIKIPKILINKIEYE